MIRRCLGVAMAFAGFAAAACSSAVSSDELMQDSSQGITKDIKSATQRPDGLFDLVCVNGSQELGVKPERLSAKDVCEGKSIIRLSQARSRLAATSVGSKAIFAGGEFNITKRSDVVDIYDADTGLWSTATLSQARSDLAATTTKGLAMFAGGLTQELRKSDVVDVYDSSSGEWTTAKLSIGRSDIAATTVGAKAVFAGGYEVREVSDVVDIYDSATNTWSTARLSKPRRILAAASLGSKAFFGGGDVDGNRTPSNVIDIYDADTNSWSSTTFADQQYSAGARYSLGAVSLGNKLMFVGGERRYGRASFNADVFSAITQSWSAFGLPWGSADFASTVVGTTALFAGGRSSLAGREYPTQTSDVRIYDATTDKWTVAQMYTCRELLAAVAVGNFAMFAGGEDGTNRYSDIVDVFDVSTGQWFTGGGQQPVPFRRW